MRYQNWDVLLFPDGSKVPLQEFRTQCFVTRDTDSPFLHNAQVVGPVSYYHDQQYPVQLPVLTSFVGSLGHGAPFKISVHNWDRPRLSQLTASLMHPDDYGMFEARVYIDGGCTSGTIFNSRAPWPHVIDNSSHIDSNGNRDLLRFPPFHQEILQQQHWDATETLGRIKVVIAEGFSRPLRNPPFERVRDVLVFSFQHAPLNILESTGIAWPNPAMWSQPPRLPRSLPALPAGNDQQGDEDAHAHSPSRHYRRTSSGYNKFPGHTTFHGYAGRFPVSYHLTAPHYSDVAAPLSAHAAEGARRFALDPSCWKNPSPMADPFVDAFNQNTAKRATRVSLEDVPMPDYPPSSSSNSRAISNMTGISYEQKTPPKESNAADEKQINELVQGLMDSPLKDVATGTCAPANTPNSLPQMASKPSAAAEARSASYTRSVSKGALNDITLSTNREVSNTSNKSHVSGDLSKKDHAGRTVQGSPSVVVKGKKKGRGNQEGDQEGKENDAPANNVLANNIPAYLVNNVPTVLEDFHWCSEGMVDGEIKKVEVKKSYEDTVKVRIITDSKRKRSGTSASDGQKKDQGQDSAKDTTSSSPSKKVSRKEEGENRSPGTGEDGPDAGGVALGAASTGGVDEVE